MFVSQSFKHPWFNFRNDLEDRLQPLDGSQLLALDLMIFAEASWLNSSEDIMTAVKNGTLNTEIEHIELEFLAPVRQIARVVSWRLPDVKKRVVAIRGSSSANDWLFNLDAWLYMSNWVWKESATFWSTKI